MRCINTLITDYDIIYERKCINHKKVKLYGNLIFFSDQAIPIDFRDMKRRILVMEANYKVAENLDYFGKLRKVIDDPLFMPNLFAYFAEHVDLSNSNQEKFRKQKL